jgi:hypothetical protein
MKIVRDEFQDTSSMCSSASKGHTTVSTTCVSLGFLSPRLHSQDSCGMIPKVLMCVTD